MSVAALLRVKDEIDILEVTLRHVAEQADQIFVADNLSTDGTRELLADLRHHLPLVVTHDDVFAHEQGRVMSELAAEAHRRGHDWLLPGSADEFWFSTTVSLRELLMRQPPRVNQVHAVLYDHVLTSEDPDGPNPVATMGWRKKKPMEWTFGRFCCRPFHGLEFAPGCHATNIPARYINEASGIEVRHYCIRSPEQFLRKARNGLAVYEATDLGEEHGIHWRKWGRLLRDEGEEAALDFFYANFFFPNPDEDPRLVYDPILVAA